MMRNLYEVLGITRDATPEDIRRAYRKVMKHTHPDSQGGSRAAYDEVSRAHEVLMDPLRRVHYDNTGEIDDKPVDNAMGELLGTLAQLFSSVMTEVMSNERDPAREDLVRLLLRCCESAEAETAKRAPGMRQSLEGLTSLLGRFEVADDQPNHLESIMLAQARQIEAGLKHNERAVENLRLARVYLQGCKFNKIDPISLPLGGSFNIRIDGIDFGYNGDQFT